MVVKVKTQFFLTFFLFFLNTFLLFIEVVKNSNNHKLYTITQICEYTNIKQTNLYFYYQKELYTSAL